MHSNTVSGFTQSSASAEEKNTRRTQRRFSLSCELHYLDVEGKCLLHSWKELVWFASTFGYNSPDLRKSLRQRIFLSTLGSLYYRNKRNMAMRSMRKVIFKAARVTQKHCQMLLINCIGKCYFKLQEKEETEDLKSVIFVMLKTFSLVLNKMQIASK